MELQIKKINNNNANNNNQNIEYEVSLQSGQTFISGFIVLEYTKTTD